MIDWLTRESHIFFNPKLPGAIKDRLKMANLPTLPGHIWLSSSGTTSTSVLTLYALSKEALLAAAEAANYHLEVTEKDIWLNVLPHFHVGGIAILARAHLARQRIVDRNSVPWSAESFHEWCENERVTLTSLVPTQLFDLVEFGVRAPEKLRAIVLGGAATDEILYRRARELGFNCLPSFGMTECCSQVATATLKSLESHEFPALRVLPHIEVKLDDDGQLAIQSPALFTMRLDFYPDHNEPMWRVGDWYITKDRADITQEGDTVSWLKPTGRSDDEIKISGELVNLAELNKLFHRVSGMSEVAILSQKDSRRGHEIVVALPEEAILASAKWIEAFNREVVPVGKIMASYFVEKIPRTELGKVRVAELRETLGLK